MKCASAVANATIHQFKCGKYNNADLKVLRLQQIKPFECGKCNNSAPLKAWQMQQYRPTSVAIATGKVLQVLHMQQLMPGSVALATVLAFECCECNSAAFKVLRMQQHRLQTVANATV